MEEPQRELMKCLKRLYEDEEHSDLVIKCRNAKYNVHKALICPRSEFFAAACRWKSAVVQQGRKRRRSGSSVHEESETQVVDLDDDDPVTVWAMVQYLYHLEYPTLTTEVEKIALSGGKEANTSPGSESEARTWWCLHKHAMIYSVAEKYGISGLKSFARGKFKVGVKGKADLGAGVDFFLCVREVYTGTPQEDRGLRGPMAVLIRNNMDWIKRDDVLDLMAEIPQIAIDVLTEYHRHTITAKTRARAQARVVVRTRAPG